MPRANLTTASVERLKPPATGQVDYFDQRLPGFGLRISYHGTKSWFLMTRVAGKLIRVTLGKFPALSLADAREEARAAARLAAEGKDPREAQDEARRRQDAERRNTFGACAAEFLDKHVVARLRPSTQREYRRILTGPDTAAWRDRPIREIAKRDVVEVIEAIDRRGSPGSANRTLVYLQKFFGWCAERDIIEVPPTERIPRPHPEVRRDRVLTNEEVACLLQTLEAETGGFAPLVRILLLTGQRRSEVAGMRRSELRNLDGPTPLWEIPKERTKNKLSHLVPLVPAVRDLIQSQPDTGDLVFTTTGETPLSGFGHMKARLDKRIASLRSRDGKPPMPAWTLHDLRRTMVTAMNEQLGIPPHVVEAVVNHISGSKAGVAGTYNRALYLEDRRKALEAWAELVGRVGTAGRRSAHRGSAPGSPDQMELIGI